MRYLRHYTDDPEEHLAQIESLNPKAQHALEVMEYQLQRHEWIAGQDCTIADYALYPYTRVANEAGFELDSFPAIKRWLLQIEGRPRFIPMEADGAEQTVSFADYFRKNA
jgi:glutathione S-transferase